MLLNGLGSGKIKSVDSWHNRTSAFESGAMDYTLSPESINLDTLFVIPTVNFDRVLIVEP